MPAGHGTILNMLSKLLLLSMLGFVLSELRLHSPIEQAEAMRKTEEYRGSEEVEHSHHDRDCKKKCQKGFHCEWKKEKCHGHECIHHEEMVRPIKKQECIPNCDMQLHEIWSDRPACEATRFCREPIRFCPRSIIFKTHPQCICREGFIRSEENRCIPLWVCKKILKERHSTTMETGVSTTESSTGSESTRAGSTRETTTGGTEQTGSSQGSTGATESQSSSTLEPSGSTEGSTGSTGSREQPSSSSQPSIQTSVSSEQPSSSSGPSTTVGSSGSTEQSTEASTSVPKSTFQPSSPVPSSTEKPSSSQTTVSTGSPSSSTTQSTGSTEPVTGTTGQPSSSPSPSSQPSESSSPSTEQPSSSPLPGSSSDSADQPSSARSSTLSFQTTRSVRAAVSTSRVTISASTPKHTGRTTPARRTAPRRERGNENGQGENNNEQGENDNS